MNKFGSSEYGVLPYGIGRYGTGGGFIPYFQFNGDGFITVPTLIDFSKPNKIEYTITPGPALATNRDIWSALDNSCLGRQRANTLDFRGLRGSSGVNLNTVIFTEGETYDVTEVAQPVELLTVQSIDVNTLISQQQSGAVIPGGAAVAFQIGGNLVGSLYIGMIRDFKIYNDANVLIHWWKVDEGEGVDILDSVGTDHGILTPGTGAWILE